MKGEQHVKLTGRGKLGNKKIVQLVMPMEATFPPFPRNRLNHISPLLGQPCQHPFRPLLIKSVTDKAGGIAIDRPPPIAGKYMLIAHLDPADQVPETDETNNGITRTLLVLAPAVDQVPPRVTGFTINDGAATTNEQTVSLHTTATDPEPGSGVASLLFIEFEYLPSVNRDNDHKRSSKPHLFIGCTAVMTTHGGSVIRYAANIAITQDPLKNP